MRKTRDFEAYIDDYQLITVYLHKNYYAGNSDFFILSHTSNPNENCRVLSCNDSGEEYRKYSLQVENEIVIGESYEIIDSHNNHYPLFYGTITKKPRFDEENGYYGADQGVTYNNDESSFVLWSPTSKAVILRLVKGKRIHYFRLPKEERGIFRKTIKGNWDGCKYQYLLASQGQWVDLVDPYASSLSANSEYGVVINPAKTDVDLGGRIQVEEYVKQIIYEVSVRDISSDPNANVKFPRKYLGLAESGSEYQGYPTALDYITDLGITMLQLLPVHDFGSVNELKLDEFYNWGYDPTHYLALEGGYATNPDDGYSRILEFKALIKALHQRNIAVSLDLVYNHVHFIEGDNLFKVVPNYFFRMSDEAELSNGSYCGNEFDSQSIMGRKYLLNCCLHWIKEYDIDAFRFDLMGLIDNETMNLIVEEARKIKAGFMIYGEGWDMPTLMADAMKTTIANNLKTPEIAFFSDRFRDVVKGSTIKGQEALCGYGSGDVSKIEMMKNVLTAGIVAYGLYPYVSNPNQMLNYVECHDNQTLWDKLQICCEKESKEQLLARQKLITACVLLAQGVPFLHCGQEFCRTKNFEANTYNLDDEINKVDYQRMIDYRAVVNYTKDIIQLRKDYHQFSLCDKSVIEKQVSFENLAFGILLYRISDGKETIDCFINPTCEMLNYEYDAEVWLLANEAGYLKNEFCQRIITVNPLTVVVIRNEK